MKAWSSTFGFVALLFLLLCAPLLLSNHAGGYANDEELYYLPAVRLIRAHWPALDLNHAALSAVSPGYPFLLATISLVTGPNRLPLRLVTWALSLAVLALLWRQFPPSTANLAAAAVLPLACSNFFIKSASWIVTDNPGLLGVAGVLAGVFLASGRRSIWVGGLVAGAATFVRQLHVWTMVPLLLQARRQWPVTPGVGRRALLLAPLLLPLGVLAVLVAHWHGFVPPAWQGAVSPQGAWPVASLVYLLAVFLLLGLFYHLALAPDDFAADWRSGWTLLAAAAGLGLTLIGPTDFNMTAGRWGGYLWLAAAQLPAINHRSILFLIMTPLGAALLAVLTQRLARLTQPATALGWLGSFLAWASTALSSRLAFHRYYEPTILLFLVFWIVLMMRGSFPGNALRLRRLQTLAILQAAVTLATAHYQTYGRALLAGHGYH